MTRKITILVATCALALGASTGSASADAKITPGCKGEVTSNTVRDTFDLTGTQGMAEFLEQSGMSHEQFRDLRDQFCAPFVPPF
jgi:hypothetical protein